MPRKGIPDYKTPTKARIKGAAEFLDYKGILYNNVKLVDDRRHDNNLDKDKARRRPPLLTTK
ncbi:hypothetical protein GQ44DRAFT_716764 [Phaeosphaeriaceae sp. PMI808]|nr:hypothetical protein GQ44DRAFT_716764 [Phaeosphaeriaceae sp. PMI808]